jgi:hypothetical protein
MVENRTTRQTGCLFEPTDRGAFVAEPRETSARRREDLVATCIELVLANPGHGFDRVTRVDRLAIRTYGLPTLRNRNLTPSTSHGRILRHPPSGPGLLTLADYSLQRLLT